MKIVGLRKAVADAIKEKLPDLAACDTYAGRFDLESLKALSTKSPAVFVAILGSRPSEPVGDGTHTLELKLSAFVIAKDAKGLPRHDATTNICETLTGWIPSQRFGVKGVGDAGAATFTNLYSKGGRVGAVSLQAVTWNQKLTIGEADEDPTAGDPVPTAVYVGLAPEIGDGHEPDYEEVTGE